MQSERPGWESWVYSASTAVGCLVSYSSDYFKRNLPSYRPHSEYDKIGG